MTPRKLLAEILLTRIPARLLMIVLSLSAALFGILAPLFQREFLNHLMQSESVVKLPQSEILSLIGAHHPLILLAWALVALIFSLMFSQGVIYLGAQESFRMQRQLSQRLYDSTLQLRSESLQGRPIGELVSVYSTDIPGATILLEQSLPQGLSILFPLILAPAILVHEFHIPWSSILIALAILLVVNFWLAYRQSKYFFLFKTLAAERIGVVNEWIQNIRALRVLGWIDEFEKRIFKVRADETTNRIAMLTNGQSMNAFSSSITYFLNLILIGYLAFFLGMSSTSPVTPAGLLTLLWIVAVFLTRPFRQLPWFFTFIFDGWTSIKRLHIMLSLQESQATQLKQRDRSLESSDKPLPEACSVEVDGLSYSMSQNVILENLNFKINPGEFVAVVGEVGSGKSSLLMALMRENSAQFKNYHLNEVDAQKLNDRSLRRHFSFVPQEGFIMSSSLKENVLLDYSGVIESDDHVLQALSRADFDPNREGLALGLSTEIGERGVNLSGGQKQRISMSRVDVREAPVLLLDDCLSAVDVHTERRLLDRLFKGVWKHRTRLLVTHRLTVLKEVDRILFLHNGKLSAFGTYEKLLSENSEFRDFTASLNEKKEGTDG